MLGEHTEEMLRNLGYGSEEIDSFRAEMLTLRRELRGYFVDLMTPEVQEECARGDTGGPHCLEAVRQMLPERDRSAGTLAAVILLNRRPVIALVTKTDKVKPEQVAEQLLAVTALGDEVNEGARIQESAREGAILASKALVERLSSSDADSLGIDRDRLLYRTLSELPTSTEKAKRDAGSLPVTPLR